MARFFPINKTTMLAKGTFKDKLAFITGGGTGLGYALADTLASLGANLFLVSRREKVLQDACSKLSSNHGTTVRYHPCDVRNNVEVLEAIDKCQSSCGLPDVVVNNAAGNFLSPSERLSSNAFRTVIDIVLQGTANVTLEWGKRMIRNGDSKGAVFLQITTPYAQSGSAFVMPSAAAKAGVEAMAKSLAAEWSMHGLRFICLAPGPIYTEGAFSRLDPSGQFQDFMVDRNPTKRIGDIKEFANLSSYLVSDYASWLNGTSIVFDGGDLTMRSGEMNDLLRVVTPEMWDALEQQIRKSNARSKEKSETGIDKPASKL